ncbi:MULTISPECIES: dTMP kinase [Marinobacter]|nr:MULTISPECIES: dTMP kinase [Marinobacter]MCP4065145.1 dTMP kinase [Gammaproteobacteria bacterium]PTC00031.1 dTMP kinase [Marinobacter sp. Z-F4-2]HBI79119.1 dTMP kinase [Marinobacter adhaerens]MAK50054.1 dTMP kinase [Marinobacter sp.]MAM51611.1 dTMP kinase [Marinobacter sp.]|tara:strand:- start:6512 stop:7153 length:642 start_codon:yes stop_codon:yes gene_type:complete
MSMRGQFITFEGTEGVGKSTQLANAASTLENLGVDVLVTREPGGTPMAEHIRELLLATRDEVVHETTELLLMFAARAQHLHTRILPALDAGQWVLCDRFTDATFAYQGGGRGVSQERIALLENLVQGNVRPDHVILFDAPVETGMARARRRGELDRFEQEDLEFFQRIRNTYLDRANEAPDRYHIINAARPLNQVSEEVVQLLTGLLSPTGHG